MEQQLIFFFGGCKNKTFKILTYKLLFFFFFEKRLIDFERLFDSQSLN